MLEFSTAATRAGIISARLFAFTRQLHSSRSRSTRYFIDIRSDVEQLRLLVSRPITRELLVPRYNRREFIVATMDFCFSRGAQCFQNFDGAPRPYVNARSKLGFKQSQYLFNSPDQLQREADPLTIPECSRRWLAR